MTRILVFGDSIAYGAWDREGGWVQRLRKSLDERNLKGDGFYCIIYNLGVSGDTTADLLERLESETKQRIREDEETILIFAIGANDTQFFHGKKMSRCRPDEFKGNILKIIKQARKYSSKVVFVGLFPIDEKKTVPWDEEKSFKNEYLKRYDGIIKSVCKENGIHFVDIFGKIIKSDYSKLLEDGLHPNSYGHHKIFEVVGDFVTRNKII
jgi:acyl-CoA thioesterase I